MTRQSQMSQSQTSQNQSKTLTRVFIMLLLTALLLPTICATRIEAQGLQVEMRDFASLVSTPVVTFENGQTLRASRVRLPRINGLEPATTRINAEIDTIERALAGAYETQVENGDLPGPMACYNVYESSDLTSLVVRYRLPREREEALVYNLDTRTGEALSQTDFLARQGIQLEPWTMAENVRQVAFSYHNSASPTVASQQVAQSLTMYQEHPESCQVFLKGTKHLGFVCPIRMESGGQRLVEADFDPIAGTYDGGEVNPDFLALENAFDIQDPTLKAFIIPLGYAYDQQSLRSLMFALFNGMESFGLAPQIAYVPVLNDGWLAGYEHYLLVPKNRHEVIGFQQMAMSEEGTLTPDGTPKRFYSGKVMISMNQSEIFSNAEISLSDLTFAPYISGKDGSLVLPDEVKELRFDWQEVVEAQDPTPLNRFWENEILPVLAY